MVKYVTVLRAIAAVVITNSHYIGVYPADIIASGGMLGNVVFFGISGFGLANVKLDFKRWYIKRLVKVYPTIWIITAVYIILGFYTLNDGLIFSYFIYPTYYHFIASIIILYIPYYFIAKSKVLRDKTPLIMLLVFLFYLVIYFTLYDASYYHIDNVREPMIRFLFFESMLLGLYFRVNHAKYVNKNYKSNWILLITMLFFYFLSKISFSRLDTINSFQFINQIILFTCLFLLLESFAGIENNLKSIDGKMNSIIELTAKLTLQIYAVQYVIIPLFNNIFFPLNWIIITIMIFVTAYILYLLGNKTSNVILKNI